MVPRIRALVLMLVINIHEYWWNDTDSNRKRSFPIAVLPIKSHMDWSTSKSILSGDRSKTKHLSHGADSEGQIKVTTT